IRRELKERCFNCNENIGFKIKNIKYIISSKDNIVLKANTPLPKNGTCVHYKKSYRWFRFPCCNKLYPCDVCHDDNNSKNHLYSVSSNCGLCDVKYTGKSSGYMANIMVCGFCSLEQSVKKECKCGMNMKKNTMYWEGGKGMRNKQSMSRKDSKKYKK
ncbi:Zinc finger protein, partial [Spraguea lophii 42_110]